MRMLRSPSMTWHPEVMLTLILLIVALVLFIIAALPLASKVNLLALGLASLAGALIASHFGV